MNILDLPPMNIGTWDAADSEARRIAAVLCAQVYAAQAVTGNDNTE